MHPIPAKTLLRCALLSLLALPAAGCDPSALFGPRHVKHHAKVSKPKFSYDAQAFTLHLALARITLATTYDAADADADLDVLQAYAVQKKRKAVMQTILVMDYKTGDSVKKIVAPISQSGDSFPALLQIINTLGITSYTPQDIRVLATTVDPSPELSFTDLTTDQVRATLDQEQQHLLDTGHKLASLDDVRMQIELSRFFMKHKQRDPAYLAVANAQQELAAATQDKAGDEETIRKLSAELDTIEGQLHKSMPFGL